MEGKCPVCDHREAFFFLLFFERQRLSTLFLFFQAVFFFQSVGNLFNKQSFILGFRYMCHQKQVPSF